MDLGLDIVLTIIIVVAGSVGTFFTVKTKVEKVATISDKQTDLIESLTNEVAILKTNIKTDIHDSVEKEDFKISKELAELKNKLERTHSELLAKITDLTSNVFNTIERNKDTLHEKLVDIREESDNKRMKIYEKLDIMRKDMSDISKLVYEINNEIKSITKYELTHIKNNITKLEVLSDKANTSMLSHKGFCDLTKK